MTTNGANSKVDNGIIFMPKKLTDSPTKEQHYFRNELNLDFTWMQLEKMQKLLPDNMKWDDKVSAALHQKNKKISVANNKKYVSFDGHFELMYDYQNILLTAANDPYNMGTYNYSSPSDSEGHIKQDVEPYGIGLFLNWGNVPEHAGEWIFK
jgi:hypothetical protein